MEISIHFPPRSKSHARIFTEREKNFAVRPKKKQRKQRRNTESQYVLETNYKAYNVNWADCAP